MKKLLTSLLFLLLTCGTLSAAAITESPLTSGSDTTDTTSYATASISPSSNKLILAVVFNFKSGTAEVPALSGNGLTWVNVANILSGAGTTRRLSVFRALGSSPSSGVITIDFSGNTQLGVVWAVSEFDNVDTSGTDGSGAIVQSVTDDAVSQASPYSVTLASFGNVNNATFGAFGKANTQVSSPGSGFSEIFDEALSTPDGRLVTEWKNSNDTSVDITYVASVDLAGIAVEIKNAEQAITATTLTASGNETNLTVYTTASVTPSSNNLVLLFINGSQLSGNSTVSTVTGNGLTWVEVDRLSYGSAWGVHVYRALGFSPSTGAITITFASGQTRAVWSVVEFGNVDLSGANGSGAVVQSVSATSTGTAASVTLASFSNAKNATYGGFGMNTGLSTWSALGSGFSELHRNVGISDDVIVTEWRSDNDTVVDATSSSSENWAGIAIEIKNVCQEGGICATLLLNDGSETDLTVYTTASVSPTADTLLLLVVRGKRLGTTNDAPTIAGNSLTWVQIEEFTYLTDGDANRVRVVVFRSMGAAPSTGTIAITWGGIQIRSIWILTEFTNVDTGGSNGANAVVQSGSNHQASGATNTVTLSAFSDSLNATWGSLNIRDGGTSTPGSGFTQISTVGFNSIDSTMFKAENDTTVDWTDLPARDTGVVAVEIKSNLAAASGASAGARGARIGFTF